MKEIELTAPRISDFDMICMVWILNLATVPSPAPTIISPFGSKPIVPMPKENNLLTGPRRL